MTPFLLQTLLHHLFRALTTTISELMLRVSLFNTNWTIFSGSSNQSSPSSNCSAFWSMICRQRNASSSNISTTSLLSLSSILSLLSLVFWALFLQEHSEVKDAIVQTISKTLSTETCQHSSLFQLVNIVCTCCSRYCRQCLENAAWLYLWLMRTQYRADVTEPMLTGFLQIAFNTRFRAFNSSCSASLTWMAMLCCDG